MRPGPGLVVMALAFISGARRGSTSTSTSQQTLSSLTSSSFSSSPSSYSTLSSKSSLLLFPSKVEEYQNYQKQQQLPSDQRTRSKRHSPYSSSSSSHSSSSSSSSISDTLPSSALSSSYSLFHSLRSSDTSVDPQKQPSSLSSSSSSSSLSSDYRNSFTIYNYDRNNDDIEHNYHFDNFKLDKISYVNVEDYGENIEEVGIIGRSGGGASGGSGGEIEFEDDDRGSSHSHIFESTSSLSRVNPWLSACDLAQPSSAPDLQGQCTAGSLPVAWVDEGPGPPTCPKSCEQLNLENKYNSNTYSNNNNNNKLANYDSNYIINLDNNNNFNPVNNIMSKVRREIAAFRNTAAADSATAKTTTIAPSNAAAAKGSFSYDSSSQITTIKTPGVVERTTTTVSTASINANKMVADKTVETPTWHQQSRQHQQHDIMQSDSQSSTQDHQYNYNNFKSYNNIVKNKLNNNNNNKNVNTNNNNNKRIVNDNSNQYNQNQQQQQCLDYLGDNDDSSPTQLCKNSRSDLANKLRTLRLKHCCERTVFSALHTIALNATLGGGPQCVRILTDILDLDILATRITCELAEILFRYDCRQIYSLIHQCKDCKEAYRRWVCSTLIPYFAEHSSTSSANAKDSATTTPPAAATSNSTNNYKNNKQADSSDKYSINNNDENFERDKPHRDSLSVYDDEESAESPPISTLSSSSALSIASAAVMGQQYQQQQEHQLKQQQDQPHPLTKRSKDDKCKRTKSNSKTTRSNIDERGASDTRQSEDSISTANNEDPCVEDPVISRLLKRTKRKVEFRKRRRIRPCLSVCQTVEQKCPYLLPGDRAPAYPTQYAGEPTFLCLDQNIPETGEQLLKSNHGPPECCYRYCAQPQYSICIYCDDFSDGSGKDSNTTAAIKYLRNTSTTLDDRLALPSTEQENFQSSDPSSNNSTLNMTAVTTTMTTITSIGEIAKLPYYAYSGNVYYYDDITDLPTDPIAECQPVASTTSRCTIPYYASSASKVDVSSLVSQRVILIWSSIFWYLVNNYILVTVHNTNGSNYRFYYYCCYNLNDWWRRLIVLTKAAVSL